MTNTILMAVLSNIFFASGLALLTLVLARLSRNPHLTHTLWLLVLIKLVTPPLVEIPIAKPLRVVQSTIPSGFVTGHHQHSTLVEKPGANHAQPNPAPILPTGRRLTTADAPTFVPGWSHLLMGGWLMGTMIFVVVALRRHARFLRLVAESPPAEADLVDDANRIAARMELSAVPRIRTTTAHVGPVVTGGWRRRLILLPQQMLAELSRDQIRAVLAHELAHIRRRDHLVQLLKFSILAVHWWNPLAWWASRQLEQSQEACCDAWVVWALPDHRRTYGEALLRTVEFLTERRLLPVVSETFMAHCILERRIEMILKQTIPRSVSRRATGVAVMTGLVFLPTAFSLTTAAEPAAQASSTKQAEAPVVTSADLPYVVEFEQGATRFLDGDEITIREVRGTAETFRPGHIYRIKGTYKLASRDKATVAAFTTATNASDGRSRSFLKVQHASVDRGEGEFALFLPMHYPGWPHVSFYPQDGGQSFGGNYFGTGDYVLEKWWPDGGDSRNADGGDKPNPIEHAMTLDKVLWADAPELRHRLSGQTIDSIASLGPSLVARIEGYTGDWEGLKRHQAANDSVFRLEAQGRPTLKAWMRSGGITFGSREAWVLLIVEGKPDAGIDYALRAPDPSWIVASAVPPRTRN